MKKTSILALVLAFTAILPACGNTSATEPGGTDTTVNLIDKYTEPPKVEDIELPEGFVIPEGYTYETSYSYFPNGDNSRGIYNVTAEGEMDIYGDKMFYTTGAVQCYIDAKTGQSFALCPDPLCDHSEESGCPYRGFAQLKHHPEKDNIMFAVQGYNVEKTVHYNICVIDETNGTITKVYGTDVKGSEVEDAIYFQFISGDKIYFTGRFFETETDKSGNVVSKIVDRVYTLDMNTYEVKKLDNEYSEGEFGLCLTASKNHILFCDFALGKIYVTDINFNNQQLIVEYDPETFFMGEYCYDSITDEIYFSVASNSLSGRSDEGVEEGYIYCLDSDLNCKRLDFCDTIVNFALTRNYIYFTKYDPIVLGKTINDRNCVVVNGGKFYRITRDGMGEEELVFDGGVGIYHFIHHPFAVMGDYIYYPYTYLHDLFGYPSFHFSGRTVRIGITDKTVKSLSFN